jgi:Arc/MetJ family transcription regulator
MQSSRFALLSAAHVYTHTEVYVRTNIVLDDRLIKEVMRLS